MISAGAAAMVAAEIATNCMVDGNGRTNGGYCDNILVDAAAICPMGRCFVSGYWSGLVDRDRARQVGC